MAYRTQYLTIPHKNLENLENFEKPEKSLARFGWFHETQRQTK